MGDVIVIGSLVFCFTLPSPPPPPPPPPPPQTPCQHGRVSNPEEDVDGIKSCDDVVLFALYIMAMVFANNRRVSGIWSLIYVDLCSQWILLDPNK